MRAMIAESFGGPDRMHVGELDIPTPRAGEVRVRVTAAAANHADVKVLAGMRFLHARRFPLVVGYDFAGVVDMVSDGVEGARIGDRVFGHLQYNSKNGQGAFSEYVIARDDAIAQGPDDVDDLTLAAAATPGLTALQALRDVGGLKSGGSALIIGASGGVGSLGVGIAKRLGARVTASCSRHALTTVGGLGADEVLDRGQQSPMTSGRYDVVLDSPAAYSYFACRRVLSPRGAYVTTLPTAGWLWGKVIAPIASHTCGLVIVRAKRPDLEQLAAWMADGLVVPIDSTYGVLDVGLALGRLKGGGVLGRVVVRVADAFD